MTTFNGLVEEVLLGMEGYAGDQAVIGTLSVGIDADDNTFTVAGAPFEDGLNFSTGLVEVGEELVYAQAFNRTTGVFTGVLRGWRGSTAVAHVAGEIIRSSPSYPRLSVKKAINDTIENLPLFAVKVVDITATSALRYALPADFDRVLDISQTRVGMPWLTWEKVTRWSVVREPGGSLDASSKAIDVPASWYGNTIRVTYAARPTPLSALSDNFATVSGLEDSFRDIVVLGAMAKLTTMPDIARILGVGVDQSANIQTHPVGQGGSVTKLLLALYQQRVAEAKDWQSREWPALKFYSVGGSW